MVKQLVVLKTVLIVTAVVGWAQLNENCTVSVLNRTVQVGTNGNWSIANVPAGFGPVRARAVCVNNGTTSVGQSGLFTVLPNQSTGFDATMILGPVTPIPDLITVTSPNPTLTSAGAITQIAVNGHYPSTVTANITAASTGTTYTISNPAIATVSTEGLVQAVSSGTVIIQAMNEGATGMTSIRVVLNATDSDHDGIPETPIHPAAQPSVPAPSEHADGAEAPTNPVTERKLCHPIDGSLEPR